MKWAEVGEGVVVVQVRSDRELTAVTATAYADQAAMKQQSAVTGRVKLEGFRKRDVALSRGDLGRLELDAGGGLQLLLEWEDSFAVAQAEYKEEAGALQLVKRSAAVAVDKVVGAGLAGGPQALPLVATHPGRMYEYVFLAGDGGGDHHEYHEQAITHLLMSEFDEEMIFDGAKVKEAATNTIGAGDAALATLLRAQKLKGEGQERVVMTRLLEADSNCYGSENNLGREDLHWWPIERVERRADTVSSGGGIYRLYDYLEWAGKQRPGHVREVYVLAHATLRGPAQLGSDGETEANGQFYSHSISSGNDDLLSREHLFEAFESGGRWTMTGCTGDTLPPDGTPGSAKEQGRTPPLVIGPVCRSIECALRASIRLRGKASGLKRAIAAGDAEAIAQARAAVTEKDEGGYYAWQRLEECEAAYQPAFNVASHGGKEFVESAGAQKALEELRKADSGDMVAMERAADAVVAATAWAESKKLKVSGNYVYNKDQPNEEKLTFKRSVEEWVEQARWALSAQANYAAALAYFARAGGASNAETLTFMSGVPGWDGQHMKVEVKMFSETGEEEKEGGYEFSTHFKHWSNHQAFAWATAFFLRFRAEQSSPHGFLMYQAGRLDPGGVWKGADGYAGGFDTDSL